MGSHSEMYNITFIVSCGHNPTEETLMVVGDVKELGGWNVATAVPLTPHSTLCGVYTATVSLSTPGFVQFKFVICRGRDSFWEAGSNRLKHVTDEEVEVDCGSFNTVRRQGMRS